MTALDTAKAVLAKASLTDQTFANPDLGIAVAWAEILGNVDRGDALTAVAAHYGTETRRLMPADVLAGVRRIRGKRLAADFEDIPELDAVAGDPLAFKRTLRGHRARVAAGWVPPVAEKPSARLGEVQKLLEDTIAAMPTVPPSRVSS